MKRIVKIIIFFLFGIFIIAQFIRPSFTNPAIVESETLQSSAHVPENAQAILNRSCNNCHTNETVYPWYAKIQPSASFLDRHIREGRNKLNFSVWNTYQTSGKKRKLEEICDQVETRAMPLPSYIWLHGAADLSDNDIKTLCDWTKIEVERLEAQ
ncbi:MAG: cytochrome [Acidobacteria bacterium]|jgi:hypothetical protein|nr:cytochrome [Acidobacteriota bacterium]